MWVFAVNVFLLLANLGGPQYGAFRNQPQGAWVCIGTCGTPNPTQLQRAVHHGR